MIKYELSTFCRWCFLTYVLTHVHVRYMPLPFFCLSVTFVRPTQQVDIFGNFSRRLVPWPSIDIHGKYHLDRPRGTLRRPRAFQRDADEPCTLPLSLPKDCTKRDLAIFKRKF